MSKRRTDTPGWSLAGSLCTIDPEQSIQAAATSEGISHE